MRCLRGEEKKKKKKSANSLKSCTPKYVRTKYITIFQLKEGVEMEMMNIKIAKKISGNLQDSKRRCML